MSSKNNRRLQSSRYTSDDKRRHAQRVQQRILVALGAIFVLIVIVAMLGRHDKKQRAHDTPARSVFSHELPPNIFQLERLITHHPSDEIARNLWQDVLAHRIVVAPRYLDGDLGQFSHHESLPLIDPTTGQESMFDGPVIRINIHILNPRDRRLAELTLYHEYVHYLQWQRGILVEGFPSADMPSDLLEHHCKTRRHAELDAYRQECALARTIGAEHEVDLCLTRTEDEFLEAFHASMRTSQYASVCGW